MQILQKESYHKLIEHLKKVEINYLFARSVIEHHVAGTVYVDNVMDPKSYYIVHPYGMSLLYGDCHNPVFNTEFRDYTLNIGNNGIRSERMQAYPEEWNQVLNELFYGRIVKGMINSGKTENGKIELFTRVNFRFNRKKYLSARQNFQNPDILIKQTDNKIFERMTGSVIPIHFWNNMNDFLNKGIGFTIMINGEPASMAFSAFIHENKLELGIETLEKFRRKGYAGYACAALIDYCIHNDYEPVWACVLENKGSYNLACSLGFEPVNQIPVYKFYV